MSFTGEEPDGAGGDRRRLAQVAVPLDATGLADLNVMAVAYEAGAEYDPWVGVAWTEWFEHAPMPASMIDAWELEPLDVDLERYSLGGEAAQAQAGCQDPQGRCDYWRLEGTCTWGGRPGDCVASADASGLGRFRGDTCVGVWAAAGEATAFAFEARRVRDGDLEFLEGTVTWEGDEDVGADATLSLLRVGPPPTSPVPGAPAGGVSEDGTGPSDTGPTDTGTDPTDTGIAGAAR